VAQVLKRVAGVTVQDNKYVTVRGMSERYNNVQLNGASMPSTEPNRRNFSFDVIPSALVSNVTIAKTFTPDLPGEFTGGLVEIETLSVPESPFLNITLGTGFNTIATGKEFLSTKRFAADYFFGGIDERQWYTGRSQEELTVNAANAASWNCYPLYKYTAQPLQSYSIAGGLPFKITEHQKMSLVFALTYRNEQGKELIKEYRTLIRDSILQEAQRYTMTTTTGAIANVGWETKGHNITWRNLFNNRFSHSNQKRYMMKTYEGYPFMDIYSVVLNNRIMQTQLDGKHKFFNNRLLFNWNASLNDVVRTNPGNAYASARTGNIGDIGEDTRYEGGRMDWSHSAGSTGIAIGSGHLMYSNLHEQKKNLSADMEMPFTVLNNPQRIKTGYWGAYRTASYRQQYLKLMRNNRTNNLNGLDIYDFFDPAYFQGDDPVHAYVRGGAQGGADYYDGRLDINAGYLMGEFSFFHKLHLTGGFRMEKGNNRVITTWGRFVTEENKYVVREDTATLDRTDWLPALSLVYNITAKLNARLAYSKTIIRPDFRELSYCAYYNVNDRLWVYNLKPLKQTGVENYDLRLEYYPAPGEVISLSAFYKKFTDPVEMIAQMQASAQEYWLYSMNLKEAEVRGLELNFRKNLHFIAPNTFLENIYINGNFSLVEGNIAYNYDAMMNPIEGTGRERPLQGLSPYAVNAGLSYQGSRIGMTVNYGRIGRRLVIGGEHAKYDQYENPRNVLDLQISASFLKQRLEVKLNASDLLNEDIIVYRNTRTTNEGNGNMDLDLTSDGMDYNPGDHVMSRIGKGINFSASVGYKF
jgi:TonB-dependent receptor